MKKELIDNLRQELLDLEEEKKRIDEKILDITRLLARYVSGSSASSKPSIVFGSIREAVMYALENAPKVGVRPREATQIILKAGYQHSGETPLNNRVGMELHKLYQEGEIERAIDGRYKLR